jgi:hypothetical protein
MLKSSGLIKFAKKTGIISTVDKLMFRNLIQIMVGVATDWACAKSQEKHNGEYLCKE